MRACSRADSEPEPRSGGINSDAESCSICKSESEPESEPEGGVELNTKCSGGGGSEAEDAATCA